MSQFSDRLKTDDIATLQTIDPLLEVEKMTGLSYDDPSNIGMGLAAVHALRGAKEKVQCETEDTFLSNELDRYQRLIEQNGFEKVFELPFANTYGAAPEMLFIYAHRDGLLLRFDTFEGIRVNAASVYYNVESSMDNISEWISSGGIHCREDGSRVWVGNHDARESLFFNMNRIRENGKFLPIWEKRPFLWLLHHADTKTDDYDCDAINAERIALLPDWVKEMIGDS